MGVMNSSPLDFHHAQAIQAEQAAFMRKVYAFMAAGLALTGVVAFGVSQQQALMRTMFVEHRWIPMVLLGVELVMVFSFSALAARASATVAAALFLSYSAV
ncbi:MAG: Inhibitor of apoptosis-promoting Bax1, partial [Pseudomonadota bacterium]